MSDDRIILEVPGLKQPVGQGGNLNLFFDGTGAYKQAPSGSLVQIDTPAGPMTGTVTSVLVGPLIDMIVNYGSQSPYTYNRPVGNLGLVQALTKLHNKTVLDVTDLWTVLMVQVDLPFTPNTQG